MDEQISWLMKAIKKAEIKNDTRKVRRLTGERDKLIAVEIPILCDDIYFKYNQEEPGNYMVHLFDHEEKIYSTAREDYFIMQAFFLDNKNIIFTDEKVFGNYKDGSSGYWELLEGEEKIYNPLHIFHNDDQISSRTRKLNLKIFEKLCEELNLLKDDGEEFAESGI